MNITIRYYGQLAEITGQTEESLAIADSASLGESIENLRQRYPAMQTVAISAARNNETAEPETILADGDQIDLFPPFAGG
jgi:molybdopterin converting factor small subunit